jgi:GTP cyclohydrolase I
MPYTTKIGSAVVKADEIIKALIECIGDDPSREGLKRTPDRIYRSWGELYSGYMIGYKEVKEMLTQFDGEQYDEIVLLKGIEFASTCEHHMLPFLGTAHIAYIPDGKVIGISKLARLLEVFSRRLQIQERICQQVTQALMDHVQPKGAACILEAKHLCISCRGVNKQQSVMVTSSMQGCFKEDVRARQELLSLIKD